MNTTFDTKTLFGKFNKNTASIKSITKFIYHTFKSKNLSTIVSKSHAELLHSAKVKWVVHQMVFE